MPIPDLTKIFTISRPRERMDVEIEAIADMQKGESYTAFGKRMCMLSNGNALTLRTILQRIYHYEKSRQLNDENLQRQHREAIIKEIEKKEVEISEAQTQKKACQKELENIESDIAELKEKRLEAINKTGQENKMAKLKLILGCIILVVLTVYLFVFYSSTFFSAFFKDFGTGDFSVGEAMFDSQTIPKAFDAGLGELIFILSAPIIFLGLGFALHFFSIQKGLAKYFKIAAVVIITFVFDCILAYAIAKKIYDINVMTSWGEVEPFDLSMAFTNHDVWAVIFCGFVVYIIWGIVFDMTMTAYEDLKTNKTEIGGIDCRLDHSKQLLADKHVELNNYEGLINKLIIERKGLNASLATKASFDPNIIKRSFSEFFQGWTTVLGALLLPDEESKSIYEQEVNTFISIPK